MNLRELIELKIKDVLNEISPDFSEVISVEIPNNKVHGDYSSNISMKLAKVLRKSPMEIAGIITEKLVGIPEFRKIEAIQPGFINFTVNENIVFKEILDSSLNNKFYSSINSGKKVIIEHTSVNPNKAMHIGHLRNAVLGDVLSNVYKKLGYQVEVQNYIDDTGLQVADTTNAILNLGIHQKEGQTFDDYCWDIYSEINKQYETNTTLLEERKKISKLIEEGNNEVARKSQEIVNKIVDCHLELMSKLGIFYDLLVYESDIINFGFWEQAFKQLKESPNFYLETEGKQAGCWVLKYDSERFGNKIFVRSNGTKVYTAKDTAYQLWKFEVLKKDFKYSPWFRKFFNLEVFKTDQNGNDSDKYGKGDIVINIIDERQTYPQEMVKHALKSLGYAREYENYKHLAYGVVTLSPDTAREVGLDTSDNKSSYAMSGRKGLGVKITQLIEIMTKNIEENRAEKNSQESGTDSLAKPIEIALGALKHYMLKYNPSSEITFDYKEALRLSGNTGPYLQYSVARASSILKKAGISDYKYDIASIEISDSEKELINLIGQWNEVINYTLSSNSVSQIAEYAFKLSAAFHSFYEKNNVLKSEEITKSFRLTVIKAYYNVITEVLSIMGIKAPDQM